MDLRIPFQILREITDGFSEERKLGEGAFGVVYKGVTRQGDDVAVKMLRNSRLNFKQLKNEFYNLKKLNHQNIVQVLGYCFEAEQKTFIMPDRSKVFLDETHGALCLEYVHNGSLQRLLSDEFSGLEWLTRLKIIKGTCEGLKYIHEDLEEPIYHLDLKPDNILLDKHMVPKIADFGLSRIFRTELTRITQNPYGTQGYQPPEYIDTGEISRKFDIFSLGVIMIRIVSGPEGYPKCLDMSSDKFIDQNWRNRWQKTYGSGSLVEAYCHQVKTCIQIALSCVEKGSQKRHNIGKITEKLNEIETAFGEIPQKGCHKKFSRMPMHNTKNIDMRKESEDIKGQHQNITFMMGPSCTSSDVVEELIVGRTEEKGKIIASLLEGIIGKTTFARLIYNDPNFKCFSHVWVDVSRRFDLNKICESMISQLSGKESQAIERQIIHSCLAKLLSGKKILIVLDDMWEDDQFHLQELKDMLYHADSNIIILVTTRSERVAGRICTNLQPYKILPLTNEMCWDIIKQRRRLPKKCGGVALAAQSLGFTLRSMDFDQWIKVKDSDTWNEPISNDASLPNPVLASLKLSYSHMDSNLKKCFTYCAIFPKGHKIVKDDVIYQWISLDFIKPTSILSNMQLGEKYIMQLLGLSFFQQSVSPTPVRWGINPHHSVIALSNTTNCINQLDWDIKTNYIMYPTVSNHFTSLQIEDDMNVTVLTMHDLVHDLARSIMLCKTLDASKQCNAGGSKFQFVLLNDCTKSLKSFTQYPTAIRALCFVGTDKTVLRGASLSSAKYLCVLDLSKCSIQKLPYSIGNLRHLRYLNAPRVKHRAIPNYITKLTKLIYLSLRGSSEILVVPESIGELKGLMYLDLSGCSRLEKLPVSFGMLTKLVHLDMSYCSHVTSVSESLESLTNLEYLNLSSRWSRSIEKRTLPEALSRLTDLKYLNLSGMSEAMRNLTELHYLNLSWCSTVSRYEELSIFLECISNLPNLEHLDLSNTTELMKVPDCICSLRKLHVLDLSYCRNLRSLPPVLHEMDSLKMKTMKLNWTRDSERFVEDMEVLGELVPPITLEELRIDGYSNVRFPQWFTGIADHLSNLSQISLSNLPNCNALPPLGQLPNLEGLELNQMSGISKIDGDLYEHKDLVNVSTRGIDDSLHDLRGIDENSSKNGVFSKPETLKKFDPKKLVNSRRLALGKRA
ncbi:hypothetical protein PVAP13_8NG091500 [Panicum virgatum]|uniref:non-specific serine/threonine protein kinase n=1 Tax=Panicum virgatum TaxID=38727 RepID=A0A8T0P800_PANVG|nr:hypothetical protein PVAP13_8NG091500 [Panicum virgatum]